MYIIVLLLIIAVYYLHRLEYRDTKHYVTFIINTNEKEKILDVQSNYFISKMADGSYSQSFTIDFYDKTTYITSSNPQSWLHYKNKSYNVNKLPNHILPIYSKLQQTKPYFYVSYKKYSFYLDYEKDVSMDIYTDIVYEYKEKYPLHFNILTLSSPHRWKNLDCTRQLPFLVTKPTYSKFSWVSYFDKNIR